jgi:hypothetical protein
MSESIVSKYHTWSCITCRFKNQTKKTSMKKNKKIQCEKCEAQYKISEKKDFDLVSLLKQIDNNEQKFKQLSENNQKQMQLKQEQKPIQILEQEKSWVDMMDEEIEENKNKINLDVLDNYSNIMINFRNENIFTYSWYFYDTLGNFYFLQNKYGTYKIVNQPFSYWVIGNHSFSYTIKNEELQKFLNGETITFNNISVDISMISKTSEHFNNQIILLDKIKEHFGNNVCNTLQEYTWILDDTLKLTIYKYLPKIILTSKGKPKEITNEYLFKNIKIYKKKLDEYKVNSKIKLSVITEEPVEQHIEKVEYPYLYKKCEKYSDIPKGNMYINMPKERRIAYQMCTTKSMQYKKQH